MVRAVYLSVIVLTNVIQYLGCAQPLVLQGGKVGTVKQVQNIGYICIYVFIIQLQVMLLCDWLRRLLQARNMMPCRIACAMSFSDWLLAFHQVKSNLDYYCINRQIE